MTEKVIEAYLRDGVKRMGGRAYKFVSPGNIGVPDRMVCMPGGRIVFIELKAPGRKSSPMQVKQQGELRKLGNTVLVIDSKEAVDEFLNRESKG